MENENGQCCVIGKQVEVGSVIDLEAINAAMGIVKAASNQKGEKRKVVNSDGSVSYGYKRNKITGELEPKKAPGRKRKETFSEEVEAPKSTEE